MSASDLARVEDDPIVQYRAISKLGPAVLASASRDPEDGRWWCHGSAKLIMTSGNFSSSTVSVADFKTAKEAVAWLRQTAGRFIRAYVARPGEPTDAVVLARSAGDRQKEAGEMESGAVTATDLDWRLYRAWKRGDVMDCERHKGCGANDGAERRK